jgi:NAD(P) transhydrogenase subunit beta
VHGFQASAPVTYPFVRYVAGLLLGGLVVIGILLAVVTNNVPLFLLFVAVALVTGIALVMPIGGADMPVVISLLNSYTGIAVAATGYVLGNYALLIAGTLVGASGAILTQLMCRAMNRSIFNVLFGAFGTGGGVMAAGEEGEQNVREITADDAAVLMAYGKKVIVVPGYGMAVAQAQGPVRELMDLLIDKGVDVEFAIHPVAGRMPGHMNVLLAEANVPYDRLKEMDEINDDFRDADVALVIGANDVTNPAARTDKGSPIYGMPILNVDHAQNVIVLKRSMASGFAGIPNPLYAEPQTAMLFGDAKKSVEALVAGVKAA